MKGLRMTFVGAIGVLLCPILWAGQAKSPRSPADRVTLASLQMVGPGLPEPVKLALLGAIFVAVGSAVRRKSSVGRKNIAAPRSLSFVARRSEPETPHDTTRRADTGERAYPLKGQMWGAIIEEAVQDANATKMERGSVQAGHTTRADRNASSAAVGQ